MPPFVLSPTMLLGMSFARLTMPTVAALIDAKLALPGIRLDLAGQV